MHFPRVSMRHLSTSQRGVFAIASGTVVGQVLALISAPLLSRLYTPRDYGVFAVLSALIVTLGAVSALRLELAIPLPAKEGDAHSLVAAGLLSSLVVALVGTTTVAIFGHQLSAMFHQPNLMPWLWIAPAAGSLMSCYLVFNQLAIRHRRYGSVGQRNLLQSVSMLMIQVSTGFAGLRPGGLVLGLSMGQLFGALSLTRRAGWRSQEAREGRHVARIRAVVSRYRRFPFVATPSGFLNVLGLQLPILMIAYWYGGEVAGWLGLTQRVLALPVALLGTAVAQVYLAEFSRAVRGDFDRAWRLFIRGTRMLVPIAAALLLMNILLSPWAFSVVFGPEWHESGNYARALSVGLFAQMIASPLSPTLVVLERQGLQFLWDVLRVVSTTIVVAGAVWAGSSALTTVWLVSGLSAALYALSWYLSLWCLTTVVAAHASRHGPKPISDTDPPVETGFTSPIQVPSGFSDPQ